MKQVIPWLISLLPAETDPLHKVTIIPRGSALGVTFSLPDREKHTISKDEMTARIMVALGGRAAEELVFNRLESGAYSDFVICDRCSSCYGLFVWYVKNVGTSCV